MKRIFRKAIVYFTVLAVLISNVSISSVKAMEKSDEGTVVYASDYGLDSAAADESDY